MIVAGTAATKQATSRKESWSPPVSLLYNQESIGMLRGASRTAGSVDACGSAMLSSWSPRSPRLSVSSTPRMATRRSVICESERDVKGSITSCSNLFAVSSNIESCSSTIWFSVSSTESLWLPALYVVDDWEALPLKWWLARLPGALLEPAELFNALAVVSSSPGMGVNAAIFALRA
eukprot:scaffold195499_cov31-Tisochrysis_lutea.AAC.3